MSTGFVSRETDYAAVEEERPELAGRNQITGAHLWASATAFFFIDFFFAYFYLRSLNNGGAWRPKGIDPPLALGTASTACFVAASVFIRHGQKQQMGGH